MAKTDDEFFNDVKEDGIQNDNTASIIRVFNETVEAEAKVEELTALLDNQNEIISKNKTMVLPELLNEMGTELWRDPISGITVELETAVNSSLPKDVDKRNQTLTALRPIGIEEILVEEFTVMFTPNDKRSAVIRAILGIESPNVTLLEENAFEEVSPLTNYQVDLIHKLREDLELGELPATEKLGCHAARLKSFLREKIAAGFGQTVKDAGIWYGKHAKFTKPKSTKKRVA